MAEDNNTRCRVWQTGVIRLLLSCPRTDSGEVLSSEPFDRQTSRTCSGIIAKITQPRRRINSYEEDLLLKGQQVLISPSFSERMLIILRDMEKDKNDPKNVRCVILELRKWKELEKDLLDFSQWAAGQNRTGLWHFSGAFTCTSYFLPRASGETLGRLGCHGGPVSDSG